MKTIVRGKNVEVPDRVRDYAERKLRRLERMLDDRTDAVVELSNEQHRSAADAHIAEVTLVIDGQTLRSHAAGASYQAALDDGRRQGRAPGGRPPARSPRLRARPLEEKQILRRIADGTAGPARERRIVKTKRFAIEPMFEEDAISRMEELGHRFFVFVNAETERVASSTRVTTATTGSSSRWSAATTRRVRRPNGASRDEGHRDRVGIVRCRECLPDGRRIGAHLPLGGGMVKAVERAHAIGATALQVFADNPTAWRRRTEPPRELAAFRERLVALDIAPLAIHAPYLINLAGPEPDVLRAIGRRARP